MECLLPATRNTWGSARSENDKMTQMPRHTPGLGFFMRADNECWRLAQICARWAVETQDISVRDAFMAMAKEWSSLGLLEAADE